MALDTTKILSASLHKQARALAGAAAIVALAFCAAYVLFCLVPYYANGIHLQPTNLVTGGAFDPKDLAPYNWGNLGFLFLAGAYMSFIGVAFFVPVTILLLVASTAFAWRTLATRERVLFVAATVASVLATLSVWSVYRIVATWLAD
jgi:hypothetical protein